MSALREAFIEAGLFADGGSKIYFTTKIRRMERAGRLKTMRDPRTGHRLFTKKHVEEIVEAFLPGGQGSWYYNHPKPTKKDKKLLAQREYAKRPIAEINLDEDKK